ncbi:hypothetical protein [Undibacterium sp. Ren11W]|uniref:hypothetical protein n=1 Tax=Undibacterium sp. Ren11W TaxID=3413045 RepID=UPI003BF2410E
MNFLTLQSRAFYKHAICIGLLFILAGCKSRYDTVNFIKPQAFKIHDVSIVWENNPKIHIDMEYEKSKFHPNYSLSEEDQRSALNRVKNIVKLLKDEVPNKLMQELEKTEIYQGSSYRIVLQPYSAYESSSGFIGTRITVMVSIFDNTGEKKWGWLVHFSDNGYTLSRGIGKPSDSFVTNMVNETMRSFQKAQLIK